jgi:hypothetical protein
MQQGNNAFNNPPSYYSYHHYDIWTWFFSF